MQTRSQGVAGQDQAKELSSNLIDMDTLGHAVPLNMC